VAVRCERVPSFGIYQYWLEMHQFDLLDRLVKSPDEQWAVRYVDDGGRSMRHQIFKPAIHCSYTADDDAQPLYAAPGHWVDIVRGYAPQNLQPLTPKPPR
jgi:hypothetical protein